MHSDWANEVEDGGTEHLRISPCVDAGSNAFAYGDLDISRRARLHDGDQDASIVVDIGAHEFSQEVQILSPSGTIKSTTGKLISFVVACRSPVGKEVDVFLRAPLPEGAIFHRGNRYFSWTPASNQIGSFPLEIMATDGFSTNISTVILNVSAKTPYIPRPVKIVDGQIFVGYAGEGNEISYEPTLIWGGRFVDGESYPFASADAKLMRESNLNTVLFGPKLLSSSSLENVLDQFDEHGVKVVLSVPVDATLQDLKSMVERAMSHPAVLFWVADIDLKTHPDLAQACAALERTRNGFAELQKCQGIQASDARQLFQDCDRLRCRLVISERTRAHLSKEITMSMLRGNCFPAELGCNDSAHQRPCRKAVRSSKVMDVARQALN